MKRPVTLIRVACLIALCLLAAAPQAALACAGWVCMPLSFDPWCDGCVYVGGEGSGGCAQSGPCSCFDVQCVATSPDEQKAVPALGFVPEELQTAGACTEVPIATLGMN